jgi:hypothetical protein
VGVTVFVIVYWLFRDESDEAYLMAGIAASSVMVVAVVVRRIILKKYQMRSFAARQLDQTLNMLRVTPSEYPQKLTIEKNAVILKELKRRSEAANVFGRHSAGHREVYEFCEQYLDLITREMLTVNPGSPRIAAFRRGREIAEDRHRRHMLKWAEIESTSLFDRARVTGKNAEKLSLAAEALAVIRTAADKYPAERALAESASAVSEFVIKFKVSDLVERANRAEDRGNLTLARKHLNAALKELERSDMRSADRELASRSIKGELERLTNSDPS